MDIKNRLLKQLSESQDKIIKIIVLPVFFLLFCILLVSSGFYLSNVANLIFRNYGPNFFIFTNLQKTMNDK